MVHRLLALVALVSAVRFEIPYFSVYDIPSEYDILISETVYADSVCTTAAASAELEMIASNLTSILGSGTGTLMATTQELTDWCIVYL